MTTIHTDFETANNFDIREVGLDRYIHDPSARILMQAYAFDDGPVELWEPDIQKCPKDLIDAARDPNVIFKAWNSSFEINVYLWLLGIEIPLRRWRDVMIQARYMAMPGGLGECSKILGLSVDEAKDADGTRLKNLFCLPAKPGGVETLFGVSEPIFRDRYTDPEDWEKFKSYCKQDVVAERTIDKRMEPFALPYDEWETWFLDQEINERGIGADVQLVNGGSFIAETVKEEYLKRLGEITKLENPNSRDQILDWARARGYPFHTMGKSFVTRAINGEGDTTPECKEALALRRMSAKTSATKLVNIKNQLSSDGRLRWQFNFFGASRTGRWSSGSGD